MALKIHSRHPVAHERPAGTKPVAHAVVDAPPKRELEAPHESIGRRFRRLAEIDRLHAESRMAFCQARRLAGKDAARQVNRAHLQSVLTGVPLAIADVVMMWLVMLVSTNLADLVLWTSEPFIVHQTWRLAAIMMLPLCIMGRQYPGIGVSPMVEFRQMIRTGLTAVALFLGMGVFCLPEHLPFYVTSAAFAAVLTVPCCPLARFMTRALFSHFNLWGAPALIYAPPDVAADLFKKLDNSTDCGLRPVAVLLGEEDYALRAPELRSAGIAVAPVTDAERLSRKTGATWVIIADEFSGDEQPQLDPALFTIPHRVFLSSARIDMGLWDSVFSVGHFCGLHSVGARPSEYKLAFKRIFDVVATAATMIVGFPVFVAICAAIKLSSPGVIFYGQNRVGRGGREFKAWKFRTMVENAEQVLDDYLDSHPEMRKEWDETHKLKKDPRVTRIGSFLRKTSLDELPQLWNVLKGEMSLIGPRPLVDSPSYDRNYVVDYPHEFEVYKSVRPGLSGLWQVSARNSSVYEMRIFWDVYYVRNWSLWLDAYIVLRTLRTMLLREGAY